nr:MAG: capsid protein [Smacoviridae sp.]
MATNFVKAQYNEVYDLGTKDGRLTIIGIHTPVGQAPRKMLSGFFDQFRKYRYLGCSLRLVPCATLPADPLAVGYEAGELQIDPREMVNPILFHGAHGTSLNMVLDQIYKNSGLAYDGHSINILENGMSDSEVLKYAESTYYAGLSDPTFKKFGIQSGVTLKHLHPLVHRAVFAKAINPNEEQPITGAFINGTGQKDTVQSVNDVVWSGSGAVPGSNLADAEANSMFSDGVKSLGWLPTRSFWKKGKATSTPTPNFSYLPKLFMGVLILPPSYKVEQYFRMVITHYFEFKGFATSTVGRAYDFPVAEYDNLIEEPSASKTVKMTVPQMVDCIDDEPTLETNADIRLVTHGVN